MKECNLQNQIKDNDEQVFNLIFNFPPKVLLPPASSGYNSNNLDSLLFNKILSTNRSKKKRFSNAEKKIKKPILFLFESFKNAKQQDKMVNQAEVQNIKKSIIKVAVEYLLSDEKKKNDTLIEAFMSDAKEQEDSTNNHFKEFLDEILKSSIRDKNREEGFAIASKLITPSVNESKKTINNLSYGSDDIYKIVSFWTHLCNKSKTYSAALLDLHNEETLVQNTLLSSLLSFSPLSHLEHPNRNERQSDIVDAIVQENYEKFINSLFELVKVILNNSGAKMFQFFTKCLNFYNFREKEWFTINNERVNMSDGFMINLQYLLLKLHKDMITNYRDINPVDFECLMNKFGDCSSLFKYKMNKEESRICKNSSIIFMLTHRSMSLTIKNVCKRMDKCQEILLSNFLNHDEIKREKDILKALLYNPKMKEIIMDINVIAVRCIYKNFTNPLLFPIPEFIVTNLIFLCDIDYYNNKVITAGQYQHFIQFSIKMILSENKINNPIIASKLSSLAYTYLNYKDIDCSSFSLDKVVVSFFKTYCNLDPSGNDHYYTENCTVCTRKRNILKTFTIEEFSKKGIPLMDTINSGFKSLNNSANFKITLKFVYAFIKDFENFVSNWVKILDTNNQRIFLSKDMTKTNKDILYGHISTLYYISTNLSNFALDDTIMENLAFILISSIRLHYSYKFFNNGLSTIFKILSTLWTSENSRFFFQSISQSPFYTKQFFLDATESCKEESYYVDMISSIDNFVQAQHNFVANSMYMQEPPQEFLDCIQNTLMDNPIILPNTNARMNFTTIRRHLLQSKNNPMTGEQMTLEMVRPDDKLREKIEIWKRDNY